MSDENLEAVFNEKNVECKIIEKVIEIRTVVPDNLCYTCFQSCFNTAFNSTKEYAISATNTLQSYAPYIITFAAGSFIATVANNKQSFVKSFKAIATIFFSGLNAQANLDNEKINLHSFKEIDPCIAKGIDASYEHLNEQVPVNSFISATEYKSDSSFSESPVEHIYMNLNNNDINLNYIPD